MVDVTIEIIAMSIYTSSLLLAMMAVCKHVSYIVEVRKAIKFFKFFNNIKLGIISSNDHPFDVDDTNKQILSEINGISQNINLLKYELLFAVVSYVGSSYFIGQSLYLVFFSLGLGIAMIMIDLLGWYYHEKNFKKVIETGIYNFDEYVDDQLSRVAKGTDEMK
ncbi:MAG: hypothetical protein LUQ09_04075 [Methanomassiliicoccales archaeon]|nr:hypothetical protein [Methanomassiliicoccales archaeon]